MTNKLKNQKPEPKHNQEQKCIPPSYSKISSTWNKISQLCEGNLALIQSLYSDQYVIIPSREETDKFGWRRRKQI